MLGGMVGRMGTQAINGLLLEELQATEVLRRLVVRGKGDLLYFPVSNDTRRARDPELSAVQAAVDGVIGRLRIVNEPKPIRWVRLLNALSQARMIGGRGNRCCLTFDRVVVADRLPGGGWACGTDEGGGDCGRSHGAARGGLHERGGGAGRADLLPRAGRGE